MAATVDHIATDAGVPAARQVHTRASRWMHWINFPLLAIMIWSGLRIYWANRVYATGIGGWTLFNFFPDPWFETLELNRKLARGMAWHFTIGWLFVINGLAYLIYNFVSGEWRHLVPDRFCVKESTQVALHDLHLRSEKPPQGRYNAAQRLSYTVIILMGILAVVTGFAIYKPVQLSLLVTVLGGYQSARIIHFIVTMGFLVFFVVHLLQVARAGWGNFAGMISGFERIGKRTKDQDMLQETEESS
jgi:thiosulfate reductase cytochrome b subunit